VNTAVIILVIKKKEEAESNKLEQKYTEKRRVKGGRQSVC
jgi:hypothetical protein